MNTVSLPELRVKAQLLCEGMAVDDATAALFAAQNPHGIKRGGLSSGGKMRLASGLYVNAPIYHSRPTVLTAVHQADNRIAIQLASLTLTTATVLPAPDWYDRQVLGFPITQILTAHNRQLAGSIYEDCTLFSHGTQCTFCVINRSLPNRDPRLIRKKPELIIAALERIPLDQYGGLTLNGGMTLHAGRGMELMVPVVTVIAKRFPQLPIAIEITPPEDLRWINRLAEAGAASLMMNLECWAPTIRRSTLPGKDNLCPRTQYLDAFQRGVEVFGRGRVSSCFVVGTEPIDSLKEGIDTAISYGVIPSPLAGRTFEDIPGYPFAAQADWAEFLSVLHYTADQMRRAGMTSTDRAGCVACRMCDLIGDAVGNPLA